MSIEMCVLGSGSSGNATVVRTGGGVFMIDAGFGPRATAKRLVGTGVEVGDVRAICLTHLDSDHFNPTWFPAIVRQGIKVFCHENCRRELLKHAREFEAGLAEARRGTVVREVERWITTFTDEAFEVVNGVRCGPIGLAHDKEGSHGFLMECGSHRAGYATDLGHVTDAMVKHFCGVDLLAIESNYDPEMEENSGRPVYLKQRIMGGAGHLSNGQAFAAVREIVNRTEREHGKLLRHIVLLHRSRQCNCPKLLRRLFEQDQRIGAVLTLAEQYHRTEWLRLRQELPRTGEQMTLAWC
jgi:phosphoribosyl 1,2-cyclic phosphodiesterase